ncbi:hypothetical protein Dimus_036317, partial [Dionaea muscipula]
MAVMWCTQSHWSGKRNDWEDEEACMVEMMDEVKEMVMAKRSSKEERGFEVKMACERWRE